MYFSYFIKCISLSCSFIFAGALNLAVDVSVIASVSGPPHNQKSSDPGSALSLSGMRMRRLKKLGPAFQAEYEDEVMWWHVETYFVERDI